MKQFLFCTVFLCSFSIVKAQNFHLTLFGGISNYQGDLQPKGITFQQANAAFGVGGLYELSEKLYIRGNITFGKLEGDDQIAKVNANRNLNFSSPLTDIHLGLEYDLLNSYDRSLVPFVFGGISVFHFDPSTFDTTGRKVALQPLGTEGQGFFQGRTKYHLTQMALPFGAGVKLSLSENIRVRCEIGLRKTFTDYLDDVSATYADQSELLLNNGQRAVDLAFRSDELKGTTISYPAVNTPRGNANNKDWYYFAGLGVSFRLSPVFDPGRHSSGRSLGCPSRVY